MHVILQDYNESMLKVYLVIQIRGRFFKLMKYEGVVTGEMCEVAYNEYKYEAPSATN